MSANPNRSVNLLSAAIVCGVCGFLIADGVVGTRHPSAPIVVPLALGIFALALLVALQTLRPDMFGAGKPGDGPWAVRFARDAVAFLLVAGLAIWFSVLARDALSQSLSVSEKASALFGALLIDGLALAAGWRLIGTLRQR